MSKFKVGDKVKIFSTRHPRGVIHSKCSCGLDDCDIWIVNVSNNNVEICCDESEMELIKSHPLTHIFK